MADLFFYGSLCHLPLLEIVLGRSRSEMDLQDAQLRDHAVNWVQDQPFPIIRKYEGADAKGVLLRDLSEEDVARLRFYEGGFDYDLVPVQIELKDNGFASAEVFFPAPDKWGIGAPWFLQDWVTEWAALSERAATEVMAWFGRKTSEQISELFPGIRRRAAAYVAANGRTTGATVDLKRDVDIHVHKHSYLEFFAVEEMDLQYRQFDGSTGPLVNRAALIVGQAVVVLPYDPNLDAVLLVEQFRTPVFMAGDPNPWVWEPIAGFQEPGETAEQAARREALEEAGLSLSSLHFVGGMYSSTGSSTEYLNVFVGVAELAGGFLPCGGTDEGEDTRTHVVDFESLMHGVDGGKFRDMPLYTSALWLARHRERLRSDA